MAWNRGKKGLVTGMSSRNRSDCYSYVCTDMSCMKRRICWPNSRKLLSSRSDKHDTSGESKMPESVLPDSTNFFNFSFSLRVAKYRSLTLFICECESASLLLICD